MWHLAPLSLGLVEIKSGLLFTSGLPIFNKDDDVKNEMSLLDTVGTAFNRENLRGGAVIVQALQGGQSRVSQCGKD